jgi:tRNA pseudouridine55 synthase
MDSLKELAEAGDFAALDAHIYPTESALLQWPEVRLSPDAAFYLKQGQAVVVPHAPTNGWVRLYAPDQCFLGMGQILDDGRVAPKRMMIGAG